MIPIQKRIRDQAPAILVMVFCSLLTILAFTAEQRFTSERASLHAEADAAQYRRTLQHGIDSYMHLSRDLVGYVAASEKLSAKGFDTYMRTADVLGEHPGLNYIGYLPRVPRVDQARFESKARQEAADYRVHAAGPDPDYVYPYLYAYPQDARSAAAKGLDFSAIPERWMAMRQARDSGSSTATAKHFYIGEKDRTPIIAVFTPIYDLNLPASTVADRRIALRGFVFSIYEIEKMIARVMGSDFPSLFDLEIYDGSVVRQNALYDGDGKSRSLMGDKDSPNTDQPGVTVATRTWQLFFFPTSVYTARYHNWSGLLVLLGGFATSAALAYLVHMWMRSMRAKSLQRTEEVRFDTVFESHPSAVYSLDLQRRFINANTQALKEFKTCKADLVGKPVDDFIVPENRQRARAKFDETLTGNSVSYDSALIDGADGRVEVNVILIPVKVDNRVAGVLAIAQNVTERKLNEWQMIESKRMLRLVINHIPQRVFWKDTQLVYMGCNDAFCRDAGLERPDDIIGKTDFELAWSASAEAYRLEDRATINGNQAKINSEELHSRTDGSESWMRRSKIPLTDIEGRPVAVLGLYEDITERKMTEQRLVEMAHYDSLTGLANRAFFYHHLEHAVAKAKRHPSLFALMYLDLDKFKSINDSFGHDVGDSLLSAFAHRIKLAVRETDVVARLGGDEFAVLLEDLPDRAAAESVARKLVATMQTPFSIGSTTLVVGTSIGVAFSKEGGSADDVVRRADQAMYEAKRGGRNRYQIEGP